MEMKYKLIYADRKTVSIRIEDDGSLTVRAPRRTSKKEIEQIIEKYSKRLNKMRDNVVAKEAAINSADKAQLEAKLRAIVMPLVKKYAATMGKEPSVVKFTDAKKRFGSCNSNGTICFSRYLAMYPTQAIEYVVVHELAHLFEMNHSAKFYAIIEKHLPDWRERKKLLKI